MQRILVTGASGFIGTQVLPLLAEAGHEIHAVSSQTRAPEEGVTWHRADLLDLRRIGPLIDRIRPASLLHLAWNVQPGRWQTEGADRNVGWMLSSLEIMRRFREAGGERLVMAGSCTEYDWRYGYCREELTPLNPNTFYGAAKANVFRTLDAYAAATGLSAAWGRVFFLYGPREHPARLVPTVVTNLLRGRPARCTHGRQLRDFLHVHDVARALVALLASDVRGAVNIGSGKPVAVADLITRIAARLDALQHVELGAVPLPPHEAPLVCASTSRLAGELRWQASIELDAGIAQTIEWWRERLDGANRDGAPTPSDS